jgi:hypothetical protein
VNLVSPYTNLGPHWLRGALHFHSTASDGGQPPEVALRDYDSRGYDFAALTDHNVFAPALPDPQRRLISLPGCEYRLGTQGPEANIIGARTTAPLGIPEADAAAAIRALDAFVIYNHPNWHFDHWLTRDMLAWRCADAIEVYNALVEHLAGFAESSDKWDILLSCGHRVWGVATDDAHHAPQRNFAWVMANADRNEHSILAALKAGRFYASSGVEIESITLRDGVLTVRTNPEYLVRFIAERGQVRASLPGDRASYAVQDNDIYVRAEVFGPRAMKAWTNPVFVESDVSRALIAEFSAWYQKHIS